jgi:hypothetical protein
MHVELDHLFICTSVGAPEADRLIGFGLMEGVPNRHSGQGTACRRFFFQDAYLELLWVVDPAEAQDESVRRTGLWERWSRRSREASPFGLGLRPDGQAEYEVPFPGWEYRPPYLPDPLAIWMGANSEVVAEPLLFALAFGHRPDSGERSRRQPLEHPVGFRSITRVRFSSPRGGAISPELRAVEQECPWLSFESGGEDLVELGFDEEAGGQSADFRPALPLIVRW